MNWLTMNLAAMAIGLATADAIKTVNGGHPTVGAAWVTLALVGMTLISAVFTLCRKMK